MIFIINLHKKCKYYVNFIFIIIFCIFVCIKRIYVNIICSYEFQVYKGAG